MPDCPTLIQRLFKKNHRVVVTTKPMSLGHNSRLWKVTDRHGRVYAVKEYIRIPTDRRDRLRNEFQSLRYLRTRGIRQVPRPFFLDAKNKLGVLEYIPGRLLPGNEIQKSHVKKALAFFRRLKVLGRQETARGFSRASEACFSLEEYRRNLKRRFGKLREVRDDRNLRMFLVHAVDPVFRKLEFVTDRKIKQHCLSLRRRLTFSERILSPSDVGFHNILISNKRVNPVFIDFEYFGWDDPVKMMSDFILQPDHPLPESLVPFFIGEFTKMFDNKEELLARFEVVCPMLWMKWSLIMLNPFLPARRAPHGDRWAGLCRERLIKAGRNIARLKRALHADVVKRWIDHSGVQKA